MLGGIGGGLLEDPVSGLEEESIGTVGGGGDGKAEAVVAEQRGEAGEGVGEAMRMADAAVEEIVLARVRGAGGGRSGCGGEGGGWGRRRGWAWGGGVSRASWSSMSEAAR